jgi:nicotinamide-nucleotide amidase
VTAESCTGGAISAAITAIAGSSAWFEYGLVSYSNTAKQQLLGVNAATLASNGAVSEAVVGEMACGALRVAGADIAVAVSGIAGPSGGTHEKPVGTVWLAWALKSGELKAQCFQFKGDRHQVQAQAVAAALAGLLVFLNEAKKNTV